MLKLQLEGINWFKLNSEWGSVGVVANTILKRLVP
jgi:hypothetical protein